MRHPTTDAAPVRVLKIVELLFQRVLDGLSNKEIADALGCSPSTICRDLAILESTGWVRRLETNPLGHHGETGGPHASVHPVYGRPFPSA